MNSEKKFEIFRMFFSILIAILVSFILIFMVSKQPVDAIIALVTGPFKSKRNLADVVEAIDPADLYRYRCLHHVFGKPD